MKRQGWTDKRGGSQQVQFDVVSYSATVFSAAIDIFVPLQALQL